jgi:hypothetical protein
MPERAFTLPGPSSSFYLRRFPCGNPAVMLGSLAFNFLMAYSQFQAVPFTCAGQYERHSPIRFCTMALRADSFYVVNGPVYHRGNKRVDRFTIHALTIARLSGNQQQCSGFPFS